MVLVVVLFMYVRWRLVWMLILLLSIIVILMERLSWRQLAHLERFTLQLTCRLALVCVCTAALHQGDCGLPLKLELLKFIK